jgi:hypothetical protein
MDRAAGIGADEVSGDTRITFQDDGQVFFAWKPAVVDRLGEGIDEHRRGGGLKVIALAFALIEHLIPEAGFRILIAGDAVGHPREDVDDLRNTGVVGGEKPEIVHERHRIPADGASPEAGGATGLLVGPRLFFRLVPAVVMKSFFRIPGGLIDQHELFHHLVVKGGLVEETGVLGEKRRGHVKAVQPHLVGVPVLVPETSLARARVFAHLLAERFDGLAVGVGSMALFPAV